MTSISFSKRVKEARTIIAISYPPILTTCLSCVQQVQPPRSYSLSNIIILAQALKLKANKMILSMKNNRRRRRNGSPADRINKIIPDSQRDRQIRPPSP